MRSRQNKRNFKPKQNFAINFEIDYALLLKTIITLALYIIIFIAISSFLKRSYAISQFEESIEKFAQKNQDTTFEVKEITLYSSATAKSGEQNRGLDISVFTDISFNIDNPKMKTIKSLQLSNFDIAPIPELRRSIN